MIITKESCGYQNCNSKLTTEDIGSDCSVFIKELGPNHSFSPTSLRPGNWITLYFCFRHISSCRIFVQRSESRKNHIHGEPNFTGCTNDGLSWWWFCLTGSAAVELNSVHSLYTPAFSDTGFHWTWCTCIYGISSKEKVPHKWDTQYYQRDYVPELIKKQVMK